MVCAHHHRHQKLLFARNVLSKFGVGPTPGITTKIPPPHTHVELRQRECVCCVPRCNQATFDRRETSDFKAFFKNIIVFEDLNKYNSVAGKLAVSVFSMYVFRILLLPNVPHPRGTYHALVLYSCCKVVQSRTSLMSFISLNKKS